MKKRKLVGVLTVVTLIIMLFSFSVYAETKEDNTTAKAETTETASKSEGGLIALTFDDGPCENTKILLDALKGSDSKVTFFVLGKSLDTFSDILIREYKEGHEIASHTWDHSRLTSIGNSEMDASLQKTEDKVYEILGVNIGPLLVRPPYGKVDDRVKQNADVPLVKWSVDTLDWKTKNVSAVKESILSNAEDGAIILVHDLHKTSVLGAIEAIKELEKQGYTLVTVSELFRRKGIEMTPGEVYFSAPNNGVDLGPLTKDQIEEESTKDKEETKEKDTKATDKKKDEGFPYALLVFCIIVLITYGLGMFHLFGVIRLPMEQLQKQLDKLPGNIGEKIKNGSRNVQK